MKKLILTGLISASIAILTTGCVNSNLDRLAPEYNTVLNQYNLKVNQDFTEEEKKELDNSGLRFSMTSKDYIEVNYQLTDKEQVNHITNALHDYLEYSNVSRLIKKYDYNWQVNHFLLKDKIYEPHTPYLPVVNKYGKFHIAYNESRFHGLTLAFQSTKGRNIGMTYGNRPRYERDGQPQNESRISFRPDIDNKNFLKGFYVDINRFCRQNDKEAECFIPEKNSEKPDSTKHWLDIYSIIKTDIKNKNFLKYKENTEVKESIKIKEVKGLL